MTLLDYYQLLCTGRFQVSPSRWHLAIITLITACFNSVLATIQWLFLSRKIKHCQLDDSPVFVIGHFRTGTTLMYEYLSRDPQFTYPTTYQCFSPKHFLISESWLPAMISFLLPPKRPMDNMQAGFTRPQEDEFALLSLAAPTIYHRLAFPNRSTPYTDTLTFQGPDAGSKITWQKKLLGFYRAIRFRNPKRLLNKSPCHTGRIRELVDMFPNAKFVHLVRDPGEVFHSIKNAWRVLELTQAFQTPRNENELDDFIFSTLNTMYESFWCFEEKLPSNQIALVKYEDLVSQPIQVLERVYSELSLGDFSAVEKSFNDFYMKQKTYKANEFNQDSQRHALVKENWAKYFSRYGYED